MAAMQTACMSPCLQPIAQCNDHSWFKLLVKLKITKTVVAAVDAATRDSKVNTTKILNHESQKHRLRPDSGLLPSK